MKRATITIPDDLEKDLNRYFQMQEAPPSLTGLLQAALRRFLEEERLKARQFQPPRKAFQITAAQVGSGKRDVSLEHDRYLEDDA